MHLTSPAFLHGEIIPSEFTCDGNNVSPPLRWSDAPEGTKSFVVLCSDPDAPSGVWRHWAAYDIPAYRSELAEGAGRPQAFEDFRHAMNDFRHFGYGGPCPPHHHGVHHYKFHLLALNRADLPIRTHPTCEEVEREAQKYMLAEAMLVGVYQR
jgi:Raf kinase inhibitor-like YbhB/YbcL family protein